MKKTVIVMTLMCLFLIAQGIFAQGSFTEPQPRDLTYDGTKQFLLTAGDTNGNETLHFYYWDPAGHRWNAAPNIPSEQYPGTYKAYWVLISGDQDPNYIEDLRGVHEETVEIQWYDQPQPNTGLDYVQGVAQDLVDPAHPGTAFKTDKYFYRVVPDTKWLPELPKREAEATYTVEYLLGELNGMNYPDDATKASGSFQVVIGSGSVTPPSPIPNPNPNPGPNPNPNPEPYIPLRPVYDGEDVFNRDLYLPATGFPTKFHKPLAVQPSDLTYDKLDMRIQIPSINMDAELTGVPVYGDSWAVEWLNDRAGLLRGSAMPGEGYSMIAAHNHLNTEEMGPFGLLFSLDENDRIFINTAEGDLQIYSVYANKLLEPDDMETMESIAKSEPNSIVLVTCENELVDGGYMNRRVVFAKPL